jgi:single-strand DNA-binding protein
MAKGVNRVTIIGNIGNEVECRSTNSGTTVASIRVATAEVWKDKETGEQQERTEWHRCKAFGRLAEIIGQYAKKGRQVFIEGRLRTEKYNKDGVDHHSTDIIIDEFQLLGADPNRERPVNGQSTQAPANRTTKTNGTNGNGQHRKNGSGDPPPPCRQHSRAAAPGWGGDDASPPF